MPIFSPENLMKAVDFGKKTAATYKAGKTASLNPGPPPAGLRPVANPITKAVVKKPAPKKVAAKPAPKAATAPSTLPSVEKTTYTILGKEIKKSTVYWGTGLTLTAIGAIWAYKHYRK